VRSLARIAAPLLASAALAAEPAARPPEAPASATAIAPPPEVATRPVPPGSREDQALWSGLITTQSEVTLSRARALQLLRQNDEARYDLALAEPTRLAPGTSPARAAELRQQLLVSWNAVYQIMVAQWPVDPRLGCRAQRLDLEVAMDSGDAPEVARTRAAARPCLDKMAGAVARLEAAIRALESSVAEAKAAVPPSPPPKGPGQAAAAAAPGASMPR
jgi:hypothetical protein